VVRSSRRKFRWEAILRSEVTDKGLDRHCAICPDEMQKTQLTRYLRVQGSRMA